MSWNGSGDASSAYASGRQGVGTPWEFIHKEIARLLMVMLVESILISAQRRQILCILQEYMNTIHYKYDTDLKE